MALTIPEAAENGAFGGVARKTNTKKFWVAPSLITAMTVTGTWDLDESEIVTNAVSFMTDDAGGAGERLYVPYTGYLNDHISRGSAEPDKGNRIIALEVIYTVGASALADFDLEIWRTTFNAEGLPVMAAVTIATVPDTVGDTGREIDEHRLHAFINARDRFFLTSGDVVHGIIDIDDGTASDVDIYGAIWHVEEYEV